MDKFRIGIRDPKTHRLSQAFYVERTDKGGIKLTGVKHRLSEKERTLLFAHFGSASTRRSGKAEGDGMEETIIPTKPGSEAHFEHACRTLPPPFSVMAENYEKYVR